MRERINRLAKGMLDSKIPKILLTPEIVDQSVRAGELTKGELNISNEAGLHMKGLVYSFNIRVKVLNETFGGTRNRIGYEVDSSFMNQGDKIEGSFLFVTNGGECEVPYSFRVELGTSAKKLDDLTTKEIFGAIAEADMEQALLLFEYQDFFKAPFMQDMRARTVYEGVRGRGSRMNQLEEFLVALEVKEMVVVSADTSVHGDQTIPVEVVYDRGRTEEKQAAKDSDFCTYFEMRLEYESGLYEERLLLGQMAKELEQIARLDLKDYRASLFLAEVLIHQNDKERAGILLNEVKDAVLAVRQEEVQLYCFYQYLIYLAQRKEGQREAVSRLLRKYLSEEGRHDYLLVLLLKVEPGIMDNPGDILDTMRQIHQEGSISPFLYLEAFKIYRKHPGLLKRMDAFELQVFHFAVRREMVEEFLAERIARLAVGAKYYHPLFYRVLVGLHKRFPLKIMTEAICSLLIKGDIRKAGEFCWFERALREGINLTRLYEYFLYTLPADYNRLLPKEVLLYFSYVKDMDNHSKSVLYVNIINYMKPDHAIYRQYERQMEQFAIEQLFESRINDRLAVLYQKFIYRDLIDVPVAKVLPSILQSFLVRCSNPQMKYVVLCYEELEGEDAFALEEGAAYVPLYFAHSMFLFQDAFGNRYVDIPYEKSPAMPGDKSELLERCFDVYPNHPMLRLQECREILDAGISGDADLETLGRGLADLPLHPLFRQKLISAMIDYLLKKAESPPPSGRRNVAESPPPSGGWNVAEEQEAVIDQRILAGLIPEDVPAEEQGRIIEILILQGYMQEAYDRIRRYGCEHVRASRMMKLCARMILQNLFDEDEILLDLAYQSFARGRYDSIILDYLCEHFNGSSEQMYAVLKQALTDRVETYDMEERLLAQMLFTGEMKELDTVFELYARRKKTKDNVIKAYFTVKSSAYFIAGKKVSAKVFGYLEQALSSTSERDKMPVIYLLALTKHYSQLGSLTTEQAKLCESMVAILLEEEIVFPYFKKLDRYASIPEELLTSVMVEYHGTGAVPPEIEIRILPLEEQFHTEEMDRVFNDIYVKQSQLFAGEQMEYRIFEIINDERICRQEGSITAEQSSRVSGDRRFQTLNQMCISLKNKDEDSLKTTMNQYIISAGMVEQLFPLF